MAVAVVVYEGVLTTGVGNRVIPEGARLYKALKSAGQVHLVSLFTPRNTVERWLGLEGLPAPDQLVVADGHLLHVLNRRRALGTDVDLVVDSSPAWVEAAVTAGFNTLLFTHAQFSHPEWRPDYDKSAKPWDSLVGRVEDDITTKASDARLQEKDD